MFFERIRALNAYPELLEARNEEIPRIE